MKAMGVYRMAGEAEWGGEDKARCRGGGGSASSFPDWLGPHYVSPPAHRGRPTGGPEGGALERAAPSRRDPFQLSPGLT